MGLRILLASWAPFRSGAEIACERLAIGLRDAGHEVTVVLGTDGETLGAIREAGIAVCHVPLALTDKLHWWRYYRSHSELRKVLRRVNPDIVHANDLPTSQMVAKAAAELGIPRICHHRWVFGGTAIDWLNKFGAERHLFVSQTLMDEMRRESDCLAASPMAVVHDGLIIPNHPTKADRDDARKQLKLPLDKDVVLFAGQIIKRKGVEDLVRAWMELPVDKMRSAELVLIGDDLEGGGQYRRQMERLASQLHCPARFVGRQRNVTQWITASDVCAVPSHVEPLGNATLEAMAYARPVIGSCVGGIPEVVINGETGLIVRPHNPRELAAAIITLLNDSRLRERLGQAGRIRCETHFSLESHTTAVVEHYHAVTSSRAALGA